MTMGGIGVDVKHERICILYDSEGRIHHTHRHVSLHDTLAPARVEECARKAAAHVRTRWKAAAVDLHALHVAAGDFDLSKRYRVVVPERRLVEIQR